MIWAFPEAKVCVTKAPKGRLWMGLDSCLTLLHLDLTSLLFQLDLRWVSLWEKVSSGPLKLYTTASDYRWRYHTYHCIDSSIFTDNCEPAVYRLCDTFMHHSIAPNMTYSDVFLNRKGSVIKCPTSPLDLSLVSVFSIRFSIRAIPHLHSRWNPDFL